MLLVAIAVVMLVGYATPAHSQPATPPVCRWDYPLNKCETNPDYVLARGRPWDGQPGPSLWYDLMTGWGICKNQTDRTSCVRTLGCRWNDPSQGCYGHIRSMDALMACPGSFAAQYMNCRMRYDQGFCQASPVCQWRPDLQGGGYQADELCFPTAFASWNLPTFTNWLLSRFRLGDTKIWGTCGGYRPLLPLYFACHINNQGNPLTCNADPDCRWLPGIKQCSTPGNKISEVIQGAWSWYGYVYATTFQTCAAAASRDSCAVVQMPAWFK